jgi:type II secretory pathway component PulK
MAPIIASDAADDWHEEERHEKQRRLRELAQWYRDFAERAGNPVIWEARLRTAKELEQEADRLEKESAPPGETGPGRRTRGDEDRLIY